MTAGFGPRNVDLSVTERIAARAMKYVMVGIDHASDEQSVRFNEQTATLSLHGESEQPGDGFSRGRLAALMAFVNMLVPLGLMLLLGEFPMQAGLVPPESVFSAVYVVVVLSPLAIFGIVNVHGSLGLLDKIDVIDHTTPKPDDRIEELADSYVDGELDREAFEREIETVFEREAEQ